MSYTLELVNHLSCSNWLTKTYSCGNVVLQELLEIKNHIFYTILNFKLHINIVEKSVLQKFIIRNTKGSSCHIKNI